jgi:hypothetical protein
MLQEGSHLVPGKGEAVHRDDDDAACFRVEMNHNVILRSAPYPDNKPDN